MTTLYHIQSKHQAILSRFEDALESDDLSPEQIEALNAELEINAAEFRDKAEAYASVISHKRHRADYLRSEAIRLTNLAKAEDKAADGLSDRISKAMQQQGIEKADTEHFRLSLRTSSAIELTCFATALPKEYQRVKSIIEADKIALKQALNAGQEIPGVSLMYRQTLRIS